MSIGSGSDWAVYSRKDPRFAYQGDGPLTKEILQKVRSDLEERVGCPCPDDLTVYGPMDEEIENMDVDIATARELEKQMKELKAEQDELGRKAEAAIVELKALSIAVEKLKANVKYMQDGII